MENLLLVLSIIVFLILLMIVFYYVLKAYGRYNQIQDLTHESKFLEYYEIYQRRELLEANALNLILFEIFNLLGSSENKHYLYNRIDRYIREYNPKVFIIINIFPAVGLAATFLGFYLNLNNLSSDIFATFEKISSIFLIGFLGIVLFGIGTVLFNYFQKKQDNLIVSFWYSFLNFEKDHLPPPNKPEEFYELINKSINEMIYNFKKINENFLKLSENTERFINTIENKNSLFDATLTKINEKLETFDNKVNNINNSLEKFSQNLLTFNNSINELTNRTNSIKDSIETLRTSVDTFNEGIKPLIEKNNTISDLISKIANLIKLTNDGTTKIENLIKTNEEISNRNQLIVNRLDGIVDKIEQVFKLCDNTKPKIDALIAKIDETIENMGKLSFQEFSGYFSIIKKLLEEIKENINNIKIEIPSVKIESSEILENHLKNLSQLTISNKTSLDSVLENLKSINRSLNKIIIIKLPFFRKS